jgi:hypothetical protein
LIRKKNPTSVNLYFTSIVLSTTVDGNGGLKIFTRNLFVVFDIVEEIDVQYCCVRLSDILLIGSAIFMELFGDSIREKKTKRI